MARRRCRAISLISFPLLDFQPVEKIVCPSGFVFVLKLRHLFDQRPKLFF